MPSIIRPDFTTATSFTILTGNLATGSAAQSAPILNLASPNAYADFQVQLVLSVAAGSTGSVNVWLGMSADGTNFDPLIPSGGAAAGTAITVGSTNNGIRLAKILPITAGGAVTRAVEIASVAQVFGQVPRAAFVVILENQTGVNILSAGTSASWYGQTYLVG